jgi:hypothetical protein
MTMTQHEVAPLMHAGAEKPFLRAASIPALAVPEECSPEEHTPKQIGSLEFKWWADEVAGSLKSAVDNSTAGAEQCNRNSKQQAAASEDMLVAMVTRRICRQIAKQIPGKVYGEVVGSLRGKLKVVEDACSTASWDTSSMSSSSVDHDDTSSQRYSSPSAASSNSSAMSGPVSSQMADIIARRVPQEISKWLAKEIFAQLVDEMRDGGSGIAADDDTPPQSSASSATGEYSGQQQQQRSAFPRVMTTPNLSHDHWDVSTTGGSPCLTPSAATHLGDKCISDNNLFASSSESSSSGAGSPFTGLEHSQSVGGPAAATALAMPSGELDAAHVHRKFYHDNRDAALQADAFKKFKLVLVSGRGFRVVKHNHGGGRKTRVLKYNTSKNRIFWESSKMLGGEHIDCSKLVRVSREETVVYIWHTSGATGSKKMVGLETQREYDARVLELALLHLLNNAGAPL